MTFEDLKKANELITTIKLGRKDYAEVNQRIKAFRSVYPDGLIFTELVKYEDGVVIMKASVYAKGDPTADWLISTGYAKEVEGTSNINRFSALENCETSAVGRALGFAGFGIDTSIASYEEVANAQLKQESVKLATSIEKAGLMASAKAKGLDIDAILEYVGFDRNKQPEGMNAEQYGKAMEFINKEA